METNLLLVLPQTPNVYAFWGARAVIGNVSRNQNAQLVSMGSMELAVPPNVQYFSEFLNHAKNAIKTPGLAR
jgi:hypothetical protein